MAIQQKRNKARVIYHIDMNSFYASVEMAHDPTLKGKPVAIAGNPKQRRGIIVTSSYEARSFGVRTTMPLWEARKLCPQLIVLPPNFERYREASRQMFQLVAELTPHVEPVSIDEGYIDVTDVKHEGTPIDTAKMLQIKLKKKLDLPSSIGIGPNKFLAKMASDMKKPMGITVLRIRDLPEKLWPLPIEKMYGVGQKTAEKLSQIAIETIGDLAEADGYKLTQLLGINGERLKNRANGIDPRHVDPEAVNEFKSIGNSKTLPHDTTDETEIRQLFEHLATTIEQRMHRRQVAGLSVQIMIRYYNHQTITRSQKLNDYIYTKEDILQHALILFHNHWNLQPVRLLGITVTDVIDKQAMTKQLNLFTYEQDIEKEKLQATINDLTKKYGAKTFKQLKAPPNDAPFRTSFQKDFLNDYKRFDH
ncbi:MAG TPA: DNA polymerase IV [Bacillota bacterium]|nr:DNA polymerase IV [Bacillota bacterium]